MKQSAIVFFLSFIVLSIAAPAQEEAISARKEGVITGRVLGEDGQPVARVVISLYSPGLTSRAYGPVRTDREGNFKSPRLPIGLYKVDPSVPGFVADSGQQAASYRVGEHVTIRMVKGGVITGRVLDAQGEPVVGVRVWPRKIREAADKRTILETDTSRIQHITDDQGVYRLFGLPAGIYLVQTSFQNPSTRYYQAQTGPTYHPSSSREGAAEITVQNGQEISGIDIRERTDRGIRVSGRVIGEAEAFLEFGSLTVNLVNRVDGRNESAALVRRSGEFEFNGVFEGDYEIFATKYSSNENLLASPPQRLSIRGADLTGLSLTLKRLGSIAGRVVIETATPSRKCNPSNSYTQQEIMLAAAVVQRSRELSFPLTALPNWVRTGVQISEKGEFVLRSLLPGTYQITADMPDESWYLKSLDRGKSAPPMPGGIPLKLGETINDVQFTITDGGTSLAGRVEAKKKMRVYLFPVMASNDLLRHAERTTNPDGSFQFNHLAPGKYLLLAKPAPAADPEIPQLWNAAERAALRREAEAAKKEIELLPCKPVKSYALTP